MIRDLLTRAAVLTRMALSLALISGVALAQSAKPPVPAGTDAGGVAVALLGPGIDYTKAGLAARLARDGEGDPIGRDFVAGDNRPYEPADASGRQPGTEAALTLIRLLASARLVAVREHPADPAAIGRMLAFTTQSPAAIAVWLDGAPSRRDWPILLEAAKRFPHRLIIVPAPTDLKAVAAVPPLPNLVFAAGEPRLVAGSAPKGVIIPKGTGGEANNDIAASLWVAAMAARALQVNASLDATALARVIFAASYPQK